jgi:hypothetical protein
MVGVILALIVHTHFKIAYYFIGILNIWDHTYFKARQT